MRWLVLPLLALAALSGCLGDDEDDDEDGADDAARREMERQTLLDLPVTVANNRTACLTPAAALLVPMAAAQSHLPAGFVAAGAEAVFADTPAATGRGMILFGAFACPSSQLDNATGGWGGIYVLVQQPVIANVTLAEGYLDFYELGRFTDSSADFELFAARNLTVANATVVAAAMPGPVATASHAIEGEYSFALTASSATPTRALDRLWQANAEGIAYLEVTQDAESAFYVGTVTECTTAEGGRAREIAGSADCRGDTLAILFPARDLAATFHWLPGAVAGSQKPPPGTLK